MRFTSATHYLQGVRSLLKDGWTKGAAARGAGGQATNLNTATSYCMLGGIERMATLSGQFDLAERAKRTIEAALPSNFGSIPEFNDASTTNLPQVLKVIDKAIARSA